MAMVTDALGMKKKTVMQSSFCFQPFFLFYYFMFDKLENNFLLYVIINYIIYIYTNIYINNVNVWKIFFFWIFITVNMVFTLCYIFVFCFVIFFFVFYFGTKDNNNVLKDQDENNFFKGCFTI